MTEIEALEIETDAAWHAAGAFLRAVHRMGGPAPRIGDDPDFRARAANEAVFARFEATDCVYFIQVGNRGPVKIGFASGLRQRFSAVQTGNHETLFVLGAIAGGRELEGQLHGRFKRWWLRGEWYEPSRELLGFINEQAQR